MKGGAGRFSAISLLGVQPNHGCSNPPIAGSHHHNLAPSLPPAGLQQEVPDPVRKWEGVLGVRDMSSFQGDLRSTPPLLVAIGRH